MLADSSDSEPAGSADPLLRNVGWITLETAADHENWRASPELDIQYYLRRNPRYVYGTGLAMIAPFRLAIS
jgi:hypothetical protein